MKHADQGLTLYKRKTGEVARVLSPKATDIVATALADTLYACPEDEQMDVIVAIFLGFVALKGRKS